jgi:hypothetical protein
MTPKDEFYIGYSPTLPQGVRNFLFVFIPVLVAAIVTLAVVLPKVHNQYNPGSYKSRVTYQGILMAQPIPHLAVPRQGDPGAGASFSRYVLAAPNKAGFNPKALQDLSGQWVELKGLPIYRDNFTLVASGSAKAAPVPEGQDVDLPPGQPLGEFSLRGEIVDSKCYLGVMKPGQTKVHRDCAIRCISGGVPPSLVVHNEAGDVLYFLLVDRQGKAINSRILGRVADPVQVTGEVLQYGDLLVLQADPEEYQLL